ncbi:RDD family protein [Catalinimonas niigatensis]|uniref:RDD family protein n=1 Tax=Catalinimonas niigatensis TaxID=1397264 RepID=UPI0026656212|nr:RDD family protein [Catalinimonas niigatensis]WPP51445.1 RDD family protein [Catalinimonas niigatensis]
MAPNKRITFRKPKQTESLELQFGTRVFALIIDLMLVRVIVFPLLLWFSEATVGWRIELVHNFSDFNLITILVYWVYFTILEGTIGATLGKLFVRLRIYDSKGSGLSLTKAFIRFPLKIISIASLFGVLMIDVYKEKQGLHDIICGSIVRKR